MFAKDVMDGFQFGYVAQRSGRAVGIDIIDILWIDTGILDSQLHHALCALGIGIRSRHVVCIGRHTLAYHLGIDMRTTCLGVLIILHDEAGRTFAQHKAVARLRERTTGTLRVVVAGREGMERVEAADTGHRYVRIRTTRQDDVCMTQTYLVEGLCYGVGRRRASRANRETQSAQSEEDGYLSGSNARNGLRNHEGVEARYAVSFAEVDTLLLGRAQSAHTASPYYADTVAVLLLHIQSGIIYSLLGYPYRELCIAVELTHLFAVEQWRRVEALDFSGKLRLK